MGGFNRRSSAYGLGRHGRGERGGPGGGALWTPAAVAAADQGFWFAEDITGDPVVTAWVDKFASGMGNASAINTPDLTDPDGDFGTNKSITCLEASVEYFTVGAAAAAAWMHQDAAVGIAFKGTKNADQTLMLFSTHNEAASETGVALRLDTSSDRVLWRVADGTGTHLVDVASANGSTPDGSVRTVVVSVADDGADTAYEVYINGAIALSGTVVGRVTSTGNPAGGLRIGSRSPTATWYYEGKLGEVVGVKDATQAAALAAYLHRQHG